MNKKITGIFLGLCLVVGSGLSAEPRSYLMFGIGSQFDLGQLSGTIMKDGLDSSQARRNAAGEYAGRQTAIYPENTLIGLNRATNGLVGANTNGGMVGLNLNVGYEQEGIFGIDSLFWRVNVNYTQKIAGGYTSSTVAGYRWLEQEWDYKAWTIPTYIGIKLFNEAKTTGIYIAAGVNYFNGGWSVAGTIDGDTLRAALPGVAGPGGALLGDAPSPSIINENAKFNVSGFGLNWLVGAQTKVTDTGHLFFELETILSAAMGTASTRSIGGAAALAPYVPYPVVIGGQTYRVGYKLEL
ncbi:MAG: porin OmpL1 [Leptospira sp.]|nr:porin OmpL1 [Leptospira sp.]